MNETPDGNNRQMRALTHIVYPLNLVLRMLRDLFTINFQANSNSIFFRHSNSYGGGRPVLEKSLFSDVDGKCRSDSHRECL